MQSFGERLRHERETRNATIDEIASATGIHRGFLEALEKNEFDALPGGAFGKFYLRAYAEILDFDPEPLIVHYDKERRRDAPAPDKIPDGPTLRRVEASLAKWRSELQGGREIVEDDGPVEVDSSPSAEETAPEIEAAPPLVEPVLDVPSEVTAKPRVASEMGQPWWRRTHRLAAIVAAVGLAASAYLLFKPPPEPAPPPAPAPTAAPVTAQIPEPLPTPPPTPNPTPAKKLAATARPRTAPVPPSAGLSISESGIARQVGGARVEAPGGVFAEGDVAAFATRVRGGRAGETIRHVWMHRGRAVQSIRLRVGDADWRTHSTKTLWHEGAWSVEARDESGRVLAQASFTCERPRR